MADFDADVPKKSDEGLEGLSTGLIERSRHEDENVDVGKGVQLAATVTADRHERPITIVLRQARAPGFTQHDIEQARAGAHQRFDGFFGLEARLEIGLCFTQRAGIGLGRATGGRQLFGEQIEQRPGEAVVGFERAARVGRAELLQRAVDRHQAAPRVSTS